MTVKCEIVAVQGWEKTGTMEDQGKTHLRLMLFGWLPKSERKKPGLLSRSERNSPQLFSL